MQRSQKTSSDQCALSSECPLKTSFTAVDYITYCVIVMNR